MTGVSFVLTVYDDRTVVLCNVCVEFVGFDEVHDHAAGHLTDGTAAAHQERSERVRAIFARASLDAVQT